MCRSTQPHSHRTDSRTLFKLVAACMLQAGSSSADCILTTMTVWVWLLSASKLFNTIETRKSVLVWRYAVFPLLLAELSTSNSKTQSNNHVHVRSNTIIAVLSVLHTCTRTRIIRSHVPVTGKIYGPLMVRVDVQWTCCKHTDRGHTGLHSTRLKCEVDSTRSSQAIKQN